MGQAAPCSGNIPCYFSLSCRGLAGLLVVLFLLFRSVRKEDSGKPFSKTSCRIPMAAVMVHGGPLVGVSGGIPLSCFII